MTHRDSLNLQFLFSDDKCDACAQYSVYMVRRVCIFLLVCFKIYSVVCFACLTSGYNFLFLVISLTVPCSLADSESLFGGKARKPFKCSRKRTLYSSCLVVGHFMPLITTTSSPRSFIPVFKLRNSLRPTIFKTIVDKFSFYFR